MSLGKQYEADQARFRSLVNQKDAFVRDELMRAEIGIRDKAEKMFDADIAAAREALELSHNAYMEEVEALAIQNAPQPVGTVYVRWRKEYRRWDKRPSEWNHHHTLTIEQEASASSPPVS